MDIESNEKYLPIGSIVMLKDNICLYMISGYVNKVEDGKVADYIGVPYPYGLMSFDALNSFNHRDIDEIIFDGYKDSEYEYLNKILSSKDN